MRDDPGTAATPVAVVVTNVRGRGGDL